MCQTKCISKILRFILNSNLTRQDHAELNNYILQNTVDRIGNDLLRYRKKLKTLKIIKLSNSVKWESEK